MRWMILLLLAVPARAQVVEIAGGSSTLLESSGAAATFHFPNQSLMLSAGEANGHFGLGAADTREFHGWGISLGDRQLALTAGGSGLGLAIRGVSATRHTETRPCGPLHAGRRGGPIYGVGAPACWLRGHTLTLFAGGTGAGFSAPYFSTTRPQHIGAGLFYQQEFSHGMEFDSLEVLAGTKRTAVESLTYRGRVFKLSGAGGFLENTRYWNASFDLHPAQWTNFSAARTTYNLATVNSASASVLIGPMIFHGAAFQSGQSSGQAVGAGARLGRFEMRADIFRSRYGNNLAGMVGEKITRRFIISQFFSSAGGHLSMSAGGTYQSNRFAISISQQTYFVPLQPGKPFQQALSVTLSFRAPHDSAFTVATNVDPTGKLRWGVYGNTFAYGNWQAGATAHHARRTGYLISGIVLDKSGLPVYGSAISVDGEIAYTDATGIFTVRVKHSPASVSVSLDDFAAPGEFRVIDCPATATPGTPIAIVLLKK